MSLVAFTVDSYSEEAENWSEKRPSGWCTWTCNRYTEIMVGHGGEAHFAVFSLSGMGELDAHY